MKRTKPPASAARFCWQCGSRFVTQGRAPIRTETVEVEGHWRTVCFSCLEDLLFEELARASQVYEPVHSVWPDDWNH